MPINGVDRTLAPVLQEQRTHLTAIYRIYRTATIYFPTSTVNYATPNRVIFSQTHGRLPHMRGRPQRTSGNVPYRICCTLHCTFYKNPRSEERRVGIEYNVEI